MALANYTDLKASVAGWLNRADLTSQIPDFILLAEEDFNTQLRTLQQETRAAFSITGEFVPVPNDFLEVRDFRLDSSPAKSMSILPADTGVDSFTTSDVPRYFSISGMNFRFAPAPNGPYDATLVYYAKIPPLATNATNWLLTRYPSAYLYGSILQASGYIQNDPRVGGIKALYDQTIANIKNSDRKARWGGNGMAARAA